MQQEVDVWKRLRHPHILEFFGACPIGSRPFLVCAYKEHGNAIEFLQRRPDADRCRLVSASGCGSTNIELSFRLTASLTRPLEVLLICIATTLYMVTSRVYVCQEPPQSSCADCSQANILIDRHRSACLADFGLARVKSQTTTIRSTKPLKAAWTGTMRWMAPEHITFGTCTKKTDVYSFAMTMHEV